MITTVLKSMFVAFLACAFAAFFTWLFMLYVKFPESSSSSCSQSFYKIDKELTISRQHEAMLAIKLQTLENEIQEIMKFYLIDKN